MSEELEIRDTLQRFAVAMELRLRENDHKGGWEGADYRWLFRRLLDEVAELHDAMCFGEDKQQKHEAIDVANFAMMIWDIVRNARR